MKERHWSEFLGTKEKWRPASSKRDFERIVGVFLWARCGARHSKVPA